MLDERVRIVNNLDEGLAVLTRVKRMNLRVKEYIKNSHSVLFDHHISSTIKRAKDTVRWQGSLIEAAPLSSSSSVDEVAPEKSLTKNSTEDTQSTVEEVSDEKVLVDKNAVLHALDAHLTAIQDGAEKLEATLTAQTSSKPIDAAKHLHDVFKASVDEIESFVADKDFMTVIDARSELISERITSLASYLFVLNDWCKEVIEHKHLRSDVQKTIRVHEHVKRLSSVLSDMHKKLSGTSYDSLQQTINEQQELLNAF